MTWPAATGWPTATDGWRTRWQYRVTTRPACWISRYQPQPRTAGLPSTSQVVPDVLHVTVITVPAAADRIGVLRGSRMSTPSWYGLLAGRKPWPARPGTGSAQPGATTGAPPGVTAGGAPGASARHAGTRTRAGRAMYASDTYRPSASRSHTFVTRTFPWTHWPACWHSTVARLPGRDVPSNAVAVEAPARTFSGIGLLTVPTTL